MAAIAAFSLIGCTSHHSALNSPPGASEYQDTSAPQGTTHTLHLGGGELDVDLRLTSSAVSKDQILAWIEAAANGVTNYFEHFPVKQVRIEVTQDDGAEIHGVTYDGSLIRMRIGRDVTPPKLADDWTLTHEMFHLAFPDMGDNHLWMNEGLSVYLEPIARTRIGIVSVDRYWKELVEGLPNGQPEAGDRGLDHTHTWGRTYWGGALFWFEADLRIRQQTHNRKSLADAIRAILAAGGDGSQDWSVQRVIDVANRATGTTVLKDLYPEMASKADQTNLTANWKSLGIIYRDGIIHYDDQAPLAFIRKAMLEPMTKPGH